MSRILKTLLLWLLMAALPVQGMAVAIRGACCPAQHQPPAAMSPISHPNHGMHGTVGYEKHSSFAAHDHDAGASKATDAGTDRHSSPTHDAKNVSGGSCAACYGAAAPPAFAWIAASTASGAVDLSPAVWPGSHVPAGLERPPKPLSA